MSKGARVITQLRTIYIQRAVQAVLGILGSLGVMEEKKGRPFSTRLNQG